MPKPPRRMEVAAQRIDKRTRKSILAFRQPQNQDIQALSPKSPLRFWLRSLHQMVAQLLFPVEFTNILAIKYVERISPGKSKTPGEAHLWAFKQRPRGLTCSWENCENQAVFLDSRDHQIGFCTLHHEQEED